MMAHHNDLTFWQGGLVALGLLIFAAVYWLFIDWRVHRRQR
jgi:hypothetical protein